MSSGGFVGSLENMLFGDPVYDERGRVVKRNFGLMNAAMIVLLVVLGIGLFKGFPNMKPKSGKKKMKGVGGKYTFEQQVDRGAVHSKPSGPPVEAIVSAVIICAITLTVLNRAFKGKWWWD
jgi:hypothetical protein